MKSILGERRVTAVVSGALFCVSASMYVLAKPGPLQRDMRAVSAGGSVQIHKCSDPASGVSGTVEGANAVFQFECPENSTLEPVEDSPSSGDGLSPDELQRVSVFEPPARTGNRVCTKSPQKLGELVPNSTLTEVKLRRDQVPEEEQTGGRVFKLTLGSAPEAARHLCYTCVTPGRGKMRSGDTKCNVYVTVPAKQSPTPTPPADNETEKPLDSGSPSRAVFGWLVVGVTGGVMAIVTQL